MLESRNFKKFRKFPWVFLVVQTLLLSLFHSRVDAGPINDPVVSLTWPVAVEEKFEVQRPKMTYVYRNSTGLVSKMSGDFLAPGIVIQNNLNPLPSAPAEKVEPLDLPDIKPRPVTKKLVPPHIPIEDLPPVYWTEPLPTLAPNPVHSVPSAGGTIRVSKVDDFMFKNITNTIFSLPDKPSSSLTRLITGREQPTFLQSTPVSPEFPTNPKSNVLARYKIMVPLLIPQVKPRVNIIRAPEIKVVREYTENVVVPVKKNVTQIIQPPPQLMRSVQL